MPSARPRLFAREDGAKTGAAADGTRTLVPIHNTTHIQATYVRAHTRIRTSRREMLDSASAACSACICANTHARASMHDYKHRDLRWRGDRGQRGDRERAGGKLTVEGLKCACGRLCGDPRNRLPTNAGRQMGAGRQPGRMRATDRETDRETDRQRQVHKPRR